MKNVKYDQIILPYKMNYGKTNFKDFIFDIQCYKILISLKHLPQVKNKR